MTFVSDDPTWWPIINSVYFSTNFAVAACVVVIYDWVLTLGQEVELVWRKRWSLMTIMYLGVRYAGISYVVISLLQCLPSVSLTDAGCYITWYAINSINVVVTAMLGVITVARLYAMYDGSRTMLIFLIVTFLAVNITCVVIAPIALRHMSQEEFILSGTYMCAGDYTGDVNLLIAIVWTLTTAWEVLALCLAIWIAVKNFRDLRRLGPSTGSTILTVLIKSHVFYFASFVAVSCRQIGSVFPNILGGLTAVDVDIYYGIFGILYFVQMFVLGPRLILSVRAYHAKLVADSDAATGMDSIVFQSAV